MAPSRVERPSRSARAPQELDAVRIGTKAFSPGEPTMTYRAPVADIVFALRNAAGFGPALAEGLYGDLADDVVEAVLAEAGKFADDILSPLNAIGDRNGTRFKDGVVTTAPGWKEAYRAWAQAGWNALAAPTQWGGQDLPHALNAACIEMWNSAAMAFGLGPVLTMAAVDALAAHGSEELKRAYLPKLVSGEWMGTMQLTEPQAGSDVGASRTKAERAADGSYRITGQKIFITYGEHDLTDNIIHMVLARLPDAPPGTKGISLFLIPKFLLNADGSLGPRNDARAHSIEHKQGRATGVESGSSPIIAHPDVKRMLLTMRAFTRAARALCYATAVALDRAQRSPDEAARKAAHERASLLTPVAKAFSTDIGSEVASLGVQVHGGMGYIEETGAAQHYRDARIAAIYEGTNGIQAIDLVMRKLPLASGATVTAYIGELKRTVEAVNATNDAAFGWTGVRLQDAVNALERATHWLLGSQRNDIDAALAGATPYLRLFALAAGGALLAEEALAAMRLGGNGADAAGRTAIARFFAENLAVQAASLERTVVEAADSVNDADAALA